MKIIESSSNISDVRARSLSLTFQQLDGSAGSRRRQETSNCKLDSKQRSFSVNPDGRVPESEACRSGDSIL